MPTTVNLIPSMNTSWSSAGAWLKSPRTTTEKFKGQARIGPDNSLENYNAGLPFPPETIDCKGDPQAGVKWMCLAPEYCLRFDFGAWVNGRVRVLHGRVGGRSQPDLKDVADEINQHTRMRLWDHGLLR